MAARPMMNPMYGSARSPEGELLASTDKENGGTRRCRRSRLDSPEVVMLPPSHQAHDQADQENHQEDEEQDLRDPRRCRRDAAEPEQAGDQRNDEEDQSPIQHDILRLCPDAGTAHAWKL